MATILGSSFSPLQSMLTIVEYNNGLPGKEKDFVEAVLALGIGLVSDLARQLK